MVAPVSPAALIISTTMPDGPAAMPDFIFEMAFFTMSIVIGRGRPSNRGSFGQASRVPVKINVEKPFIMFNPRILLCLLAQWHFPSVILHWLVAYNINILFTHLVGEAEDIGRLVVNAFIDHLVCFVACMVHHKSGDLLGSVIWFSCASASLPFFESLGLGCDGIIFFLIPPPSFRSPSVELCCATHLLCCLQQTCLEFRPDFLSSSSHFSFHSGHMCLEDFLEPATCLRISELPHFWTWGEFTLDFGRHINQYVAHKELMLQSNLLSRNHLHIHNKFAQALSK